MLDNENRYLFKFAFKSILRNPGRSFFIGFSVSLAVCIAVWVLAFFDGMNAQIERAVVNTNTGFFQLQEKSFSRTTDASHPLEFTAELKSKLQKTKVTGISPELVLDGNISTPEGSAGLIVLGIDPAMHAKFLPVAQSLTSGEFLNHSDAEGIVIGQELAKIFRFKVGDQFILNYQDVEGQLRSEILVIRGIFQFSSGSFEKRYVYINQMTWQKLFLGQETQKILFHRISLMAPALIHHFEVKDKMKDSGLVFKTWKDLNPEMSVVIEFNDGMIRFFFIIIAITITMTILTPVNMLWQERYRELRMMNILGVSNKRFWKIGVFEVSQMIAISSLASSILLVIILSIQTRTGLQFTNLESGVQIERAGIKLSGRIYPLLSSNQIIVTFVFIIFVLSFSYLWSIHRTLKKLEAEI